MPFAGFLPAWTIATMLGIIAAILIAILTHGNDQESPPRYYKVRITNLLSNE